MSGPNGAGKTTFAEELVSEQEYLYIGADLIAEELSPEAPEQANIEAGREFFVRLEGAIERGEDLVVESTLSGLTFVRFLERFRAAGYETVIMFVSLESPEICKARVQERVLKGGHHVSDEDIERRFFRSKRNFWQSYRGLVDHWCLFSNSGQNFQEVAVGRGDQYTIVNEAEFEAFLKDIEEDEE